MQLHELAKWSKIKGIDVLGTGDFQHPKWFAELKEGLKETFDGSGVYEHDGMKWVLQSELSLIYTQDGVGRRVHHIFLAPSLEIAAQINEWLGKKGRLDYDGRPIFGFSSIEFVEAMMQISKDIMVIPAHCLLPGTLVCSNPELKTVEGVSGGDRVLTHNGRYKKITKVFTRPYNGETFRIVPWYWTQGIKVTSEHPVLAIRPAICKLKGGSCKPTQRHRKVCQPKLSYAPLWIRANNIQTGDVILYPRFRNLACEISSIEFGDEKITLDKDLCRLFGYYLSEGYSNGRDGIGFTFSHSETSYIEDVRDILKQKFGIQARKGKSRGDVVAYSKELMNFFKNSFYSSEEKRAWTKKLPEWALGLPLELQAEILRGWWRGDKGYTVSRLFAHQMKIICLRLGVLPSILIDTKEAHERRGKHFLKGRKIIACHDMYVFSLLSFFEDPFGLLNDPAFKRRCIGLTTQKHGWMDEEYAYLTVRKVEKAHFEGTVYNFEVEDDNSYLTEFAAVHNCWTPWFSIFGSKSGFNSMEECFGEKARYIHAFETGLSSDPPMNWRVSKLDSYTMISNSDAHSPYPWRLGREANVFDLQEITYRNLIDAIKTRKNFLFTIETPPEYGKYHLDGHRDCNVVLEPSQSKLVGGRCPSCNGKLTIGVLSRVEELADRPADYRPHDAIPFKSLIPLSEILSSLIGGSAGSKKIMEAYNQLVSAFGNEFNVLLKAPYPDLLKLVKEKAALAIMRNRDGRLKIQPGYDGVYGKPVFDTPMKESGLGEFV
jgi:uncharacterized protein (TIGR00375 family)